MTNPNPVQELINQLATELPLSDENSRQKWAKTVIGSGVELKSLFPLLEMHDKISSRFLWLLSNIGKQEPNQLQKSLPEFYRYCQIHNKQKFLPSLATFWQIAGVPENQEGIATHLLFQWIQSSELNVSIKSRALEVLFKLVNKHADLKPEFKLCVENQLEKNTEQFRIKASKLLERV